MVLIVLLLDVSGSMALGSRIEALNSTVRTLLALLRSTAEEHAQPLPFTMTIAAFAEQPLWIVDEPTPPEEVVWADLRPWAGQRADFAGAITEAEQMVRAGSDALAGGTDVFDDALLVVVTDRVASAATAMPDVGSERFVLFVDPAGIDEHDAPGPEKVVEAAERLLG